MTLRAGTLIGLLLCVSTTVGCGPDDRELLATSVCEAVNAERFEQALVQSEGPLDASVSADREIAECRCIASLSVGNRDRCTAELGPLLGDPQAFDWTPHPLLGKLMVRHWASEGKIAEAAELAARVAELHGDDLDLLQLELRLRSSQEDEAELLEQVGKRLERGGPQIPQRLALALAWLARSQNERAIEVLGEIAPEPDDRLALPWYETRIQAQTAQGDLGAVQQTFAAWRATGWDAVDLDARYALRLSVGQLRDPQHDRIELLRAALANQEKLSDRHIIWGLHRRLVTELLVSRRAEEALAAYDAAIEVVEMPDITRAQIERAVRGETTMLDGQTSARLRFLFPATLAGGTFWLSPEPGQAPDAGYQRFDLIEGSPIVVETAIGLHPRRYIVRDAAGEVRGSGAVWPEANQTRDVVPRAQPARPPPASVVSRPKPADGRRRVFVILSDCADWRLTEYLRTRGELPFHDHVFSEGYRAVLLSRPAFTAAAMKSLVWPSAAPQLDTFGWLHHLGLEAAGLESVGVNPLDFLSAVLPLAPNLFDTIGAGPITTANMLLAHGRIETGRHAEIVGPHGARGSLPPQKAFRSLSAEDRRLFPALGQDTSTRRFAETIAAEMDAARDVARKGAVDFFFMRLEALDLMSHGHFGPLDGVGQDDAKGPLLDTYRYIDGRLAELRNELDADDWLVLLSDHGIRSSMQHEEDAIFAVIGEGVPKGRAPGQPNLRGIPKSLAAMLEVETDWPETGATPWLSAPTSWVARGSETISP